MAENPAQDNDIESQIKAAIVSRISYFQDKSDSLTFEGVRRLLEKDLGLETHALDAHKPFVKQWLGICIESASPEKLPQSEGDNGENAVLLGEGEEPTTEHETKKDLEDANSGIGDMMEDSPIMGLMTGSKKVKANSDGSEDMKDKVVPSEARIKKAIWARASYLRENSENITLGSLRRLLEEDLELDKHILDPFKKFISQQVDEVLNAPESPQRDVSDKKRTAKRTSQGKVSSKASREESPTTSGDESDEFQEEAAKVRKRPAAKAKLQNSEAVKKRKKAEVVTKEAKSKQRKVSNPMSKESGEEDGGVSDDDNSDTSAEKPVKKKEVPKPSYGKQVEHLKSVIKSCGLSVPPVVYKKVKQAPENKREACLIKELEEILSKEGLSANPSEKEIKEVKRKKDRARELEGIDMSNIVSSSRRRSATSFAPPPKPKIPDLSESESEESEDDGEDDDVDVEEGGDEEVEDEEVADEDQENGGDGSASEESKEDNDSD